MTTEPTDTGVPLIRPIVDGVPLSMSVSFASTLRMTGVSSLVEKPGSEVGAVPISAFATGASFTAVMLRLTVAAAAETAPAPSRAV